MSSTLLNRMQNLAVLLLVVGFFDKGLVQMAFMLTGSMLLLMSMMARMYTLHKLLRLPMRLSVLSYLFIPMSVFLLAGVALGHKPEMMSFGAWYYFLMWIGALLGCSLFFHKLSRRLTALPWGRGSHNGRFR